MKRLLSLLPVLLLSVLLVLVAVLVQPPQVEETVWTIPQPAPRQEITSTTELLSASFPARVLALADGSGFSLTGGVCEDFIHNNQNARRVTLRWQNEDGAVVTCVSMVPSETVELVSRAGMRILSPTPVRIAGMDMVTMTGNNAVRFHGTGHGAAYVLTAEGMTDEALSALLPFTILTTVNQGE